MTFILSRNSKPKLVDNTIFNQISKQNLLKKQLIIVEPEKTKYQILLITIHDKCIEYLTKYIWIILFIIIIIIILWCRYKWYKNNQENNYKQKYQKYQKYQEQDQYQYLDQDQDQDQDLDINVINQYQDINVINQYIDQDLDPNQDPNQYINVINQDQYQEQNQYINVIDQNQNQYQYQYQEQEQEQNIENNEISKFDTQYTNKKDIKDNNLVKAVNFDTINNTFFDPIDSGNSNFSFI
jgi:hypothetical protein